MITLAVSYGSCQTDPKAVIVFMLTMIYDLDMTIVNKNNTATPMLGRCRIYGLTGHFATIRIFHGRETPDWEII